MLARSMGASGFYGVPWMSGLASQAIPIGISKNSPMKRNNVVILDGILTDIRRETNVIDGLEMAYVRGILSTTTPSTHEKAKHPFVVYRQRLALESCVFSKVVSGDLPVRLYGWLNSSWDGEICRSVVVAENITFDVSPELRAEATHVLVETMSGVNEKERDRTYPNDISYLISDQDGTNKGGGMP